jgi:hypothetical protein
VEEHKIVGTCAWPLHLTLNFFTAVQLDDGIEELRVQEFDQRCCI